MYASIDLLICLQGTCQIHKESSWLIKQFDKSLLFIVLCMITSTIYVMRHWTKLKSDSNAHVDKFSVSLSETWILQCKNLISTFTKLHISKIFTSTTPRAIQSWTIIADWLWLPIHSFASFNERVFIGNSMNEDDAKKEFDNAQNDWSYVPLWWESLYDTLQRFTCQIHAILLDWWNILLVSHGRIIQSYLRTITNNQYFWQNTLIINPADVYKLVFINNQFHSCAKICEQWTAI